MNNIQTKIPLPTILCDCFRPYIYNIICFWLLVFFFFLFYFYISNIPGNNHIWIIQLGYTSLIVGHLSSRFLPSREEYVWTPSSSKVCIIWRADIERKKEKRWCRRFLMMLEDIHSLLTLLMYIMVRGSGGFMCRALSSLMNPPRERNVWTRKPQPPSNNNNTA